MDERGSDRRRDARTILALFVGAVALRPQLAGIGPLVGSIQDDLDMSHAVAGLLATLPVLCFAIMAPFAGALSSRFGARRTVAAGLVLLAVVGVARAVTPSVPALLVLTVGVGLAMGMAQTMMPIAVKERAAHRPALATGVYATGLNLGSTVGAAIAVPIAQIVWGWRLSMLVFAVTAGVGALAWLVGLRAEERPVERVRLPLLPRMPLSSGTIWLLVLLFGLLGTVYHGLGTWLPDAAGERGWSEDEAGVLTAVFNAALLPAGLVVGWLGDRTGQRRWLLVVGAAIMLTGTVLLAATPGGLWPGTVLAGFGDGALFALFMTLPLDIGRTPAQVGSVVALMLGAGYLLSAVNPFLLGAIRDATGGFEAPFWTVVGAAAIILALVPLLGRERLRRARPAGRAETGG
ncbi:MAG: MFS transporter [Thermoleophilia bacterium]